MKIKSDLMQRKSDFVMTDKNSSIQSNFFDFSVKIKLSMYFYL